MKKSRDSITDIWGNRSPLYDKWPVCIDEQTEKEPDKWVRFSWPLYGRLANKSKDKLTIPLIRVDKEFRDVSWDGCHEPGCKQKPVNRIFIIILQNYGI